MAKSAKKEKGFTVLELMIVIAVIIIIAAISIPFLHKAKVNANDGAAVSAMRVISQAQNINRASTGQYKSLLELQTDGFIDKRFGGTDSNPFESSTGGYDYKVILIAPTPEAPEPNYILSARPTNRNILTATGTKRFGIDKAGVIFYDTDYSAHFETVDELHAANHMGE